MGSPVWDSEGGHPLELFLPPCTHCGHPVIAHKWHDTGWSRRRCQTGDATGQCPCKRYEAGDPKDWPPMVPRQPELPL